jgi:MFS family permease
MQPARQTNWRFVVFLAFIGWVVAYMDRAMVGPVIPLLQRDLHASNAEIGFFAVTLVYFAYAILQIPAGVWADRFGRRPLSWPALALFSICSGLTGTATGLAQFGAWRFLTGFGEGTYFSSVVSLVQDVAPEEKRGVAMAGAQSGISFGSGLAPLILGPLAAWIGWRWSFTVPAVLGLIVSYVFWRYLPEAKAFTARRAAGGAHLSVGQTIKDSFLEFKSMVPILRDRTVLLTGIAGFAAIYYLYIALTWTPSYLYHTEHIGIAMSGVLASIPPFAAIAGQFTFGYISDRVGRKSTMIATLVLMAVSLFALVWLAHQGTAALIFGLALMGFLLWGFYPVAYAYLGDTHDEANRGKALGTMNTIEYFGSWFAPPIAGAIIDHWGYTWVWYHVAIMLVVAAVILAIWLPRVENRHAPPTSLSPGGDARPGTSHA